MRKTVARMPHVTCPACGGKAHARTIGKNSPLFREVYYACRNPDACGHTFVVSMEATRTITPSSYPRPLHELPLSTWNQPANDEADNDNGRPVAAGRRGPAAPPATYECQACARIEQRPAGELPAAWSIGADGPLCDDCNRRPAQAGKMKAK